MAASALPPDLSLFVLDHSASDKQIAKVLALSNTVFQAASEGQSHASQTLAGLRSGLENQDPNIVVIHTRDEEVIGFFFSFARVQPEIGFATMHIWLAGIDEKWRGHGLFQRMLSETKRHALKCGFDHLSVCTIPSLFPAMYRILQKNGWDFVGWREQQQGRKVLMKLKIA